MINTADKVVKVAHTELGYLEKETNKWLNYKTKNAGDNNYTKYGKWYGCNGVFWCAIFVSWCFYEAFGKSKGKELMLGYSASCEEIRNRFISKKQYHSNPRRGDLIFFSGSRHSGANHIGIVQKVTDDIVYTIEGNTSAGISVIDNGGAVAKKSYKLDYSKILGYGRPKYDSAPSKCAKPTLKKGMYGEEVKNLQRNLNRVLYAGLTVDGAYGEKTTEAVKHFKEKYSVGHDGAVYGKKCYSTLKKHI